MPRIKGGPHTTSKAWRDGYDKTFGKKEEKPERMQKCPCGYLMLESEYYAFKFDVGCPRCRRSLLEFNSIG